MPDEHGLGSKLKRLFIETGEGDRGDAARTAAEEVAALAQKSKPPPAGAQAPPAAAEAAPAAPSLPPLPGGPVEPAKLDVAAIFRTTGITDEEQEQVGRARQLLSSLPAGLPLETQRQIVEGTLRTFGIDPARIRTACQREQKALDSYAVVTRQELEKRSADGQKRLLELRAEMEKVQRALEERARAQAGVELACSSHKESIGRVVAFFSPPDTKETAQ